MTRCLNLWRHVNLRLNPNQLSPLHFYRRRTTGAVLRTGSDGLRDCNGRWKLPARAATNEPATSIEKHLVCHFLACNLHGCNLLHGPHRQCDDRRLDCRNRGGDRLRARRPHATAGHTACTTERICNDGCIKAAPLLLLATAADSASAETDYPNKPVRLISDSGPGSAVDTGLKSE